MIKYHVSFLIFFLLCQSAMAQEIDLSGIIRSETGDPIPGANIVIPSLGLGMASDPEGTYRLSNIPPGDYTVIVSSVGYEKKTENIRINHGTDFRINFELKEDVAILNDILITGESEIRHLKKQPFNLNVIDTRPVRNSNLDISQVLGRSTGINIREEGGLGSGYDFSIHGLSGRQVRFFLDGVPMDQFGSSLSINNIPVNLVERVEVYKGIVPVYLGSDALGGAVNIITRQNVEDYIDASYSFGSFNTHRASLNGRVRLGKSGINMKVASFFNYSDNNYEVDVEIPDELGNLDGTVTTVPRFHDEYRSAMIQLKTGIENKKYADRLYMGLTLSGNRNNIQHGVSMDRVFGQIYTKDQVFMPSLEYSKSDFLIRDLSLQTYASFIDGNYLVADTSSRTYDWYGNFRIKNNPAIGEARWEKTLFSFDDNTSLITNNLNYKINDRQNVYFNHTYSRFVRVGEDPYDPNIVPFSDPNYLDKNIFGLSWKINLLRETLAATVFSKYYMYKAKTVAVDWDNKVDISEMNFGLPGYGLAFTWFIIKPLQVKASYENTYRLPEGFEIFGDGLLTLNSPGLQPENSDNINLGFLFHKISSRNKLSFESNYFYRGTENLIRIEATGITSQFVNLAKASSSGIESEINWNYNNLFFIGANFTYQNIINRTKYDEGRESNVYLDRIPNIPYLYGNLNLGLRFKDVFLHDDEFGINWHTRYIHEYYLKWPSQGDPDNKHIIPRQHIHNLEFTYAIDKGRYNISMGAANLFDARAYDKFRVQKPGRAVYFKMRYFFTKT